MNIRPLSAKAALICLVSTLSLSGQSQTWSQLMPGGPTAPALSVLGSPGAILTRHNCLVTFAGYVVFPTFIGSGNAVWSLSYANGIGGQPVWTQLIANGTPGSPPARAGNASLYDSVSNSLIVFGGALGYSLPVANDVWVLKNADGIGGIPKWTEINPVGTPPPPRWACSAAYNHFTDTMIVFGGNDGLSSDFNDAWVLSHVLSRGGKPTWTQLTPSGPTPPPLYHAYTAYNTTTNRFILFGGYSSLTNSDNNAVWVLADANGVGGTPAWTNVVLDGTAPGPSAREAGGAAYDLATDTLTIYGGVNGSTNSFFTDIWTLAGADGTKSWYWTQLPNASYPPAPRANAAVVYDATNKRMIVYGGENGPLSASYNDIWILNPVG